MATITRGRTVAEIEGDFVVFLIGFSVTKPWKLHKWIPVMRAMGPMIKVLSERPELGLLGHHRWLGPGGALLVQYWRSFEHLERFAKDGTLPHHPAWRRYNKQVGASGDVGIWHETYLVADGRHEAMYVNMPAWGLAAAGAQVPVTGRGDSARERLRQR